MVVRILAWIAGLTLAIAVCVVDVQIRHNMTIDACHQLQVTHCLTGDL